MTDGKPGIDGDVWRSVRTLAATSLSKNLAVLPQFFIWGLAVLMRADLQLTDTQLGAVVSGFFASSALASVPAGRLGERIGAYPAMGLGAVGSAIGLLGIATLSHNWIHVLGFMVLSGVANAVTQPATNLALSQRYLPVWRFP